MGDVCVSHDKDGERKWENEVGGGVEVGDINHVGAPCGPGYLSCS